MTQTCLTFHRSNYDDDKLLHWNNKKYRKGIKVNSNMRNPGFIHQFFNGDIIIRVLNEEDTSELLAYCQKNGFRTELDTNTIRYYFASNVRRCLYIRIGNEDRVSVNNWSYSPPANKVTVEYIPSLLGIFTFRL